MHFREKLWDRDYHVVGVLGRTQGIHSYRGEWEGSSIKQRRKLSCDAVLKEASADYMGSLEAGISSTDMTEQA